jgi:hypothetical protein
LGTGSGGVSTLHPILAKVGGFDFSYITVTQNNTLQASKALQQLLISPPQNLGVELS